MLGRKALFLVSIHICQPTKGEQKKEKKSLESTILKERLGELGYQNILISSYRSPLEGTKATVKFAVTQNINVSECKKVLNDYSKLKRLQYLLGNLGNIEL